MAFAIFTTDLFIQFGFELSTAQQVQSSGQECTLAAIYAFKHHNVF